MKTAVTGQTRRLLLAYSAPALLGGAIGVHERGSGVVFSRCVAGSLPAKGTLSHDAALRLLVSIKACAYNMPPGWGKGQGSEGLIDRYAITV